MDTNYIVVDIILGHACNFRCKYCYNKLGDVAYTSSKLDDETIDNVFEYLTSLKLKYGKNKGLFISVFGGEPLEHIDILKKFVDKTTSIVDKYVVSTNGYNIHNVKKELLEISNMCKQRNVEFKLCVSFDYALQDENRQNESHDVIWNNILWLNVNKLCHATISVISYNNFNRFHEMYLEAVKLKEECIYPIKSGFNVDRTNYDNESFDEEGTRSSLAIVKKYMIEHPEHSKDVMTYNSSCHGRNSFQENCIVSNIISGIGSNGDVYPMCNLLYERQLIKDMFKLGNVSESFEVIEERRKELFSKLDQSIPEKCKICTVSCRVYPWKTIKTDISEFSGEMTEEWCSLHFILDEYLGSEFSCATN